MSGSDVGIVKIWSLNGQCVQKLKHSHGEWDLYIELKVQAHIVILGNMVIQNIQVMIANKNHLYKPYSLNQRCAL
jgi:low affinity Fe/Cu permease